MLMAQMARAWTLAEFDRLPDDGNKYELVDGELFVTPAPSPVHERLAVVLRSLLEPYVRANGLGDVYAPRSVVRDGTSEVEPDLMVRRMPTVVPEVWEGLPTPLLVVEIVSATTRRRDYEQKRRHYLRAGVAEYWIVDRYDRTIRVVRPRVDDVRESSTLEWYPVDAAELLRIDVAAYFQAVLGPA
jgi:Uma2 family endonuclease